MSTKQAANMRTQPPRMQRGFINFPKGFFELLFGLAAVGVMAVLGAVVYGLWWVLTHVSISISIG